MTRPHSQTIFSLNNKKQRRRWGDLIVFVSRFLGLIFCFQSLCAWLLVDGADFAIYVSLQCVGGGKSTVALAAAVVSTLLARAPDAAMLTGTVPSTLLAPAADSAMLTDTGPSTLLAPMALSAMLTDAAPSTLLALCASSAMLTDGAPSTRLALATLSAMRARHRDSAPITNVRTYGATLPGVCQHAAPRTNFSWTCVRAHGPSLLVSELALDSSQWSRQGRVEYSKNRTEDPHWHDDAEA